MTNLQNVHVYTDPGNFCAEPSVAILGNGEVVIVFAQNRGLRHTDTGTILLVRSIDNGRTWDPTPVVVFAQEEDAGWNIGAICRLSDGTLLAHANRRRFFNNGVQASWTEHDGLWLTRSTDGGRTWATPWPVNAAPLRVVSVRDSILELPGGALLLPLFGWKETRRLQSIIPDEGTRSLVLWSGDQGASWRYWGTMAYDAAGIEHWYEPGLVRLRDGRLLGLLHNRRFPAYPPPGEQFAPPAGYFSITISEDEGISWSWPRPTRLWGYPVDGITLPALDGAVVAAYGYRTKPAGVRIAVSPDGERWSHEDVFSVTPHYDPARVRPAVRTWTGEPGALKEQPGNFFHIGYPSSALLDDGSVLTAYHLYSADGRQYVEAAISRVERA
jgi:hypothetical protein